VTVSSSVIAHAPISRLPQVKGFTVSTWIMAAGEGNPFGKKSNKEKEKP